MEQALQDALGRSLGSTVRTATRVHGGDVAIAFRVELADRRRIFAKTHLAPPPGFFTTESTGLQWLAAADAVAVPGVLAVSDETPAHLALEWIDAGGSRRGTDADADLGRQLAALHRAGAPCFGRADRRTTGSRALPNTPTSTWSEFYATCRLLPLARLAADSGALPGGSIRGLHAVATDLDRFGAADEPPARLHGDLWGGNRLVDAAGRSWLIDPAAHGGHREFDLAMMRLFGGFGGASFDAYHEATPLAEGWMDRVGLHQIAPLVVHAIKFGGGYVPAATAAIDQYR